MNKDGKKPGAKFSKGAWVVPKSYLRMGFGLHCYGIVDDACWSDETGWTYRLIMLAYRGRTLPPGFDPRPHLPESDLKRFNKAIKNQIEILEGQLAELRLILHEQETGTGFVPDLLPPQPIFFELELIREAAD